MSSVRREQMDVREAIGPWGGIVRVTKLHDLRSGEFLLDSTRWEVSAEWEGPPMKQPAAPVLEAPGTHGRVLDLSDRRAIAAHNARTLGAGDDEPDVVHSLDTYWTDDGELAKAIFNVVCEQLQRPRVPDLREIAADLLERR